MADREIWGFSVATTAAGKNIWPYLLKVDAVNRIDEEGASPGRVAAELGAHECLVREWHVAARRARGEPITQPGPSFAEVLMAEREMPEPEVGPEPRCAKVQGFGRIRLGVIEIEFPRDIAEQDLSKLIRVAGAS